jgi:Tol biopolymer transport system component
MCIRAIILVILVLCVLYVPFFFAIAADDPATALAQEIHDKGWIVYSAKADNGTWDLFVMRPDGSDARNLTNTPDIEEAAPRFSPTSDRILYRALDKGTKINHDKWGFQGRLMIASPDASSPKAVGNAEEYPWASWSPDGKSIMCLTMKGIRIVDLATMKVTRETPRQGIYQQLFPSPDGKWFAGTGNLNGESWNVVRMNVETGEVNAVHIFQSCTPDWFPDSQRIIYSSRPNNQKANKGYGWTQLWEANGDGTDSRLVFGQDGVHIYGGAVSPDAKYVLFTKCPVDGGGSESEGAPVCVMRMADTPAIQGESADLRALHPDAKAGPVLELVNGWEPCWTFANVGEKRP